MRVIDGRIVWAPRVPQQKIRRLYEAEARGILDEALIDEVAFALLDRCRDILTATRAHTGRATCPSCGAEIRHRWDKAALLDCPCGWSSTWGSYLSSYQGKQLHGGGAVPWVKEYVEAFDGSGSARERLVLVDRLLHQFHWGLKHPERDDGPPGPSRPLAVNLIGGKIAAVLRLLDELSQLGEPSDSTRNEARADFRKNLEASRAAWPRWEALKAGPTDDRTRREGGAR